MIKRIVPPMSNEIITLVKDTSLASIIALQEIIWAGQAFMKGSQGISGAIWPLFFTAVYYLIFNGVLTVLLGQTGEETGLFQVRGEDEMPILEVEHISKSFGGTEVLKDISFSLEKSQVLSIIGSSGSGKTTMLRCLNFLERPDSGIIRVNGETLFDAADSSAKQEEEIRKKRLHFGLVFQSFNLFPQYTALDNVMLAKELLAKEQPDYKARKKEIHDEIEAAVQNSC